MATFDFTGPSQSATVADSFTGGTTHPGIAFTYSFSGGGPATNASFSGGDFVLNDGSNIFWNVQLYLTVNPTTTVTGVAFSSSAAGATFTRTTFNIAGPGSGQYVVFTFSGHGGSLTITSFDAQCFVEGTRIATPTGEVAVEDLIAGDRVLTADGGETAVKWLGQMEINTRFQHPLKVNPICFRADALGPGMPRRDLYLSADHAVALDGMLINAGSLVNGRTIYQVAKMPLEGFTYYHVETETHEIILAEGCPAESYLDVPSRCAFGNGAERDGVPPIQEMNLPRISSSRLLPESIKSRLGIKDKALEFCDFEDQRLTA